MGILELSRCDNPAHKMPKAPKHVPRPYVAYKRKLAKEIGVRIRRVRLERKLSQTHLRDKLQLESVIITRSQHSRLERGERLPLASEIIGLCTVLNISSDWLLSGEKRSGR